MEADSHPRWVSGELTQTTAGTIPEKLGLPNNLGGWLAYTVSQISSPPILIVAAASLTVRNATAPSWKWMVIYLGLTVFVPTLYLLSLLQRNQVTDWEVQRRDQRTRPLRIGLLCAALAWAVLRLGGAPHPLIVQAGLLCSQWALTLMITRYWKISIHCMVAADFAALLWFVTGTAPLLILPLTVGISLIIWARIRLRRHTLAQTLAGTLLGLVLSGIAWTLF